MTTTPDRSAIIAEPRMTVKTDAEALGDAAHHDAADPEPIHISALAKAGTERSPLTSAAMFLSATTVIHGAPNANRHHHQHDAGDDP